MADDQKNSNVISKRNSGFPEYLDFDKLRSEGIDYLGRLSGKIWTDHNVHDPGITILEVLCYALLDLGYRTNLPAADIFARNPDDNSADNNFFTPSQILACNPLTITDFRKLLIDIEGVKNAWLEIATDQNDFCRSQLPTDIRGDNCIEYLNGLYHVYIDLEKDVAKEYEKDQQAKTNYLTEIENKVRSALMAHRNLCEDFIDIYFLCKQETGVCAEIELEENADAEKVYLDVVQTLRTFFSPAPQFYTLSQLLEKKKSIEEIFAGRPYNIAESHGFVDTEELEQLQLRKEIYLSDVYNVLFKVEGIKTVRNLALQTCKNSTGSPNKVKGWKFHIPENHTPEFSIACSGFQFMRHNIPVFVDFKKYEGLFEINFSHSGKVLYKLPSPYLDVEIPKGIFRKDLGDYYSIQNEFPRVYGIGEGGLGDSASAERKAQAYQLKGYLLFFDQLLANYLSQLQHMRSLFALSGAKNEQENHTYFINQLSTVPDLQKLLRFNMSENDTHSLGSAGSLLVFPVDKRKLLKLKEQDKLRKLHVENLNSFTFATLNDQDATINQIKNDLYFEQYECEYVTKIDDCVYYYILTSSDEVALISKRYFKSIPEAAENATSVKYIGTFDENYRSFMIKKNRFSFTVELNLLSFSKYLQLIVEDKELFIKRRQVFLNHLLSRFAEQFTDYAMLSYGLRSQQTEARIIRKKEKFLSHYDNLSSNRGKAYDYLHNNWNNDNVSGFEKRFKAISGIDNWHRHSLCNFVVDQYNNQYVVALKFADTTYFKIEETFDSREEALSAAQSLFKAMADVANYDTRHILHDRAFQLILTYGNDQKALYPLTFSSRDEALGVAGNISNLFVTPSSRESVFESTHVYVPVLFDATGKTVRRSKEIYSTEDEAKEGALDAVKKIDDRSKWGYDADAPNLGRLYYNIRDKDDLYFINSDAFKIDVNSTIIGKPDKFTYDLLDKENTFKFLSVNEFDSAKHAKANADELLILLTDGLNYQLIRDDVKGKTLLRIVDGDDLQASCSIESNTETEAMDLQARILNIVKNHLYHIIIDKIPHRWRFNYKLGYDKNNVHVFHSIEEFDNPDEAAKEASAFYKALSTLQLKEVKDEIRLIPLKSKEVTSVRWIPQFGNSPTRKVTEAISKLLEEQKEVRRLIESHGLEAFSASVELDEASKEGLFVYRLIDKDRTLARFTFAFEDKDKATSQLNSLFKISRSKARYLQLCLGGDVVVERKHPNTNANWYRYQLKCLNHFYTSGSLVGRPLILFESTKRYATPGEAEEAFRKEYMQIIHFASDLSSYDEMVSMNEIPIDAVDRLTKIPGIVFVPKATFEDMGNAEAVVKGNIINLVLGYPIRLVAHKSEEFYNLFPCEKKDNDVDTDDCKTKKEEKYVYYFILPLDQPGSEKWQSVAFYESTEKAWKDFNFFLILLRYPGNYYADCDWCHEEGAKYSIYIREVLAESTRRFATEEQAWGTEGVEKFICVAQTENAFHTYQRKEDCCYSFYVACSSGLVYHPCKYDTPQKRDDVLLKLYQVFHDEVMEKKAWQTEYDEGDLILKDGNGQPFAAVNIRGQYNICVSDKLSIIKDFVESDDNYKEVEGKIVLVKGNVAIANSLQEGITQSAWKEMLKMFICYYPISVIKGEDEKTDIKKYCIEIKLPGFNTCDEDLMEEKPCGCGNEAVESVSPCHVAWIGDCCYVTCAEAERAYQIIIQLLQIYEFYQPVFDCECYSHGITLRMKSNLPAFSNLLDPILPGWKKSEIVAINPQCYPAKELACESVERARCLINSEGLHLVEHILLRPRCFPEDCRCPQYSKRCDDETDCKFVWQVPDDDPCTEEEDICFVPGADRYSFIATVVLPAWPIRFRNSDSRSLLENMLYKETPAHVLLRILWLAPHDFCCFESKFKKWNRWLAGKRTCIDNFTVCDFLEFLFDRNYECLPDCDVCEPCEDKGEQPLPCFTASERDQPDNKFLNQINSLYCWVEQHCDYQFIPCDGPREVTGDDVIPPVIDITHRSVSSSSKTEEVASPEETKAAKKDTGSGKKKAKRQVEEKTAEEPTIPSSKRKSQVVNSRMTKYRAKVIEVIEKSKNNPLAAKVQSFIADPDPSLERLEKLVDEILQNKVIKSKGGKKLTKVQVNDLLQNCIAYYMDKICFNGKHARRISDLKKIIEKMRKAKINIDAVYNYWDLEVIKEHEPGMDESVINKLFDRT